MNFKELETKINDYVKEQNLDKAELYTYQILDEIKAFIRDNTDIKDQKNAYIREYASQLYIYSSHNRKEIKISIKKVVNDKKCIFGNKYGIVNVKIDDTEFKSLNDYYKYIEDDIKRQEKNKNDKLDNFNEILKEYNLSYDDFRKIQYTYDCLDYDTKWKMNRGDLND